MLKAFREPAWNFQVVRFLNTEGEDLIPRKDRIWDTEGIALRMGKALQAAKKPVPKYLQALAGMAQAERLERIALAQHCFWTGELEIGGLDGVLTTEAGWLDGREVTLVVYDAVLLSRDALIDAAKKVSCADKVYTELKGYRAAKTPDQKRQLTGTAFAKLKLSPMQATKINSLARTDPKQALTWLSPRQRASLQE